MKAIKIILPSGSRNILIGNVVVNLENVCDIRIKKNTILVYFKVESDADMEQNYYRLPADQIKTYWADLEVRD